MMDGMAEQPSGERKLRTMDDVPADGKRVLVRVDFNVAVGDDGMVDSFEDYRIEASLPTIEELRQRRCKVLLLSHRGRPQEGDTDTDLTPIRRRLEELLKDDVVQAKHFSGAGLAAVAEGLEPGGVVLLPNVRLEEREAMGNLRFAQELAENAELFVNEAFSVSHRAHTSVAFVPQVLPAVAGRRTVLEVEELGALRHNPENPYVAIVSGAKIQTKVGMLHDLLQKVTTLCIGGRLANVFLAAEGKFQAHSFSGDDIAAAKNLLQVAAGKLVLPVDVVIGDPDTGAGAATVGVSEIPAEVTSLCDIGPESVALFLKVCEGAKTVMWNGPVGKFETPAYAEATERLAKELPGLGARTVVGGGDTVVAVEKAGMREKYHHVSVGGGAMVAFLEGKRLPGLELLYK